MCWLDNVRIPCGAPVSRPDPSRDPGTFEFSGPVGGRYRLMLRERRLGTLPLIPTYPGGFFTSGFYLSFTDGPDGPVDGFTISTERAWKVRCDRQ